MRKVNCANSWGGNALGRGSVARSVWYLRGGEEACMDGVGWGEGRGRGIGEGSEMRGGKAGGRLCWIL